MKAINPVDENEIRLLCSKIKDARKVIQESEDRLSQIYQEMYGVKEGDIVMNKHTELWYRVTRFSVSTSFNSLSALVTCRRVYKNSRKEAYSSSVFDASSLELVNVRP